MYTIFRLLCTGPHVESSRFAAYGLRDSVCNLWETARQTQETIYCAAVTEVMWGFTPSYQYRKPSMSITSPTCRFLTAA